MTHPVHTNIKSESELGDYQFMSPVRKLEFEDTMFTVQIFNSYTGSPRKHEKYLFLHLYALKNKLGLV